MTKKRNLFRELIDGVAAMKAQGLARVATGNDKIEPRLPAEIQAQARIRRLRGKVRWEGDLSQSRLR